VRQALLTGPAEDFIQFLPALSGTINLTSPLPLVSHNLNLFGPGADWITVRRDTGGDYRIFQVAGGVNARISGLTMTDGHAIGQSGGGVFNQENLTLDAVAVLNNSADGDGGGVFNIGTLTISNSTVAGNAANADGNGGGIFNGGTLVVSSCTLAGSAASAGGAIDNQGSLTLANSTVAGNQAGLAGGVDETGGSGSHTQAGNTIIAGNTASAFPDVQGDMGSRGHNLIGNPSGGFGFVGSDLLNVDPVLGPLQDNGGPMPTMALLPGSPAVDTGDNTNAPFFDQRGPGFDRVVGGTIDIGAFEAQIGAAAGFAVSAPAGVVSGTPFDVTVTVLDASGHVASGYTGTVTFSTTDADPGVVLPADYAFTAADAGVHTFTDTGLGETTLVTPGDQTLTVTDTADATIPGNTVVTVTDGSGGAPGVAAPTRRDALNASGEERPFRWAVPADTVGIDPVFRDRFFTAWHRHTPAAPDLDLEFALLMV
jgi:hypothetical protein